ncbi:MAG: tyrosine-protein phosphatase [Clostridiales bacterium]|nr:tyrosine-protein phosphatase [Clostridiales bacterium]
MEIKRLKLKKLNNTRDLGGLPAADGKTIKYGKLIRSGRISEIPDCTAQSLKDLGLKTVVDLRIETERNEHPSRQIDGVEFIWLPLLCTATAGITREKSMAKTMYKESKRIKEEFGSADNYMIETYKNILTNPNTIPALKEFLNIVINHEDGALLWHCSGGKDRAGICAMLVEALLGVPDEVIILDYVSTQRFQRRKYFLSKFGLKVVPMSRYFKAILYGLMDARKIFILSTIEFLEARYGSVVDYCKQELGITDEQIALLRQKYLED